ncbi:MAG: DUF4011 domain-containing protein [Acholeplasmatales bacterium]|nr:DUF4011 domain-containing protein [Acholeplasmatales bacterium]
MDKLLAVTNQLLDLGKRNRLLNYKDHGLKTLAILNKNTNEIFSAIKNQRDVNVYNLDPILTEYHNEQIKENPNDDQLHYDPELVYSIVRKNLERRVILCYKESYQLNKCLKSLYKDYTQSITEKGMNSLYISFGFIKYFEEEESFLAPILLIPIELDPECEGFYAIRQYEDDVLLNPTFSYYLKSKYDIELPKYDDEAMNTYLDKIRDILPEGMEIIDGMAIGIYSFYKMNMYTDIITNKEKVLNNNNIRILLGDPDSKSISSPDNEAIYPVVNCDSSQLEAIQMAANGKSFCLQGPPGSGKSQTITNMISSLLGVGKKILFVSEKISALNVVFENLRRVKLSDFAIELHSNKANKIEFIHNLYKTATSPKYDIDLKTSFLSSKYQFLKGNLTSYERQLHQIIPNLGISLVDLYKLYLDIPTEPLDDIKLDIDRFNLYDLEQFVGYFESYVRYAKKTCYDYKTSPMYSLNHVSENYILYNLNKDLDHSISFLETILDLQKHFNKIEDLSFFNMLEAYKKLNIFEVIYTLKTFEPYYLDQRARAHLLDLIKRYFNINKLLKTNLFDVYDKGILNEDIATIYQTLKAKEDNKKLFSSKEEKNAYNIVFKYRNKKAKSDVVLSEIMELNTLKNNLYMGSSLRNTISKAIGKDLKTVNLNDIMLDLNQIGNLENVSISKEDYLELRSYLNSKNISISALEEGKKHLDSLSILFNKGLYDINKIDITQLYNKVKAVSDVRSQAIPYMTQKIIVGEIHDNGQINFLDKFLESNLPLDILPSCYRITFIKQKIDEIVEASDLLKEFQSQHADKIVANFAELDENILNINRDYVISYLSKMRPELELEGSEFKILAHENEKKRRQMPIRSLLEKIFDLALDIKPVFLMSPLSVSTYLASKSEIFDCVIFDEASQIFASDALGSIYRAKQCIIIGDTKQMPPTNFFHAQVGEEAEDEDEKEYDLESVLDKATQMFDTTSLRFHYRSRSEELITFSNGSFYNGNLITIPQSHQHEKGFGIDFYYVKDGRYDPTSRTNPIEAKRICEMVFEHFASSRESLGVVAFSNVQAELISSLCEAEFRRHPEFRKFTDPNLNEPFFVKNLETVQGDERDRIIFSICYGYNNENKFYQRFGPLNNVGGERRLNVAITRAKFNISVVASVRYTDINTKTNSKGVLLLRNYLEFAENVVSNKNYSETGNSIVDDIKNYIESLGFECFTNYGSSSFKIDIAVKKDKDFILAIMTDSRNAEYSDNLTDKYRLERLLLERLGWRYLKVYSTSWFNNKEDEMERIKEALEQAQKPKEEVVVSSNDDKEEKTYLIEKDNDDHDFGFRNYEETDLFKARRIYRNDGLQGLLKEIIHTESPIHIEYLYERANDIIGDGKLKDEFKLEVDNNLPKCVRIGDFLIDRDKMSGIGLRINSTRPFKYIYFDEILDGLKTIIENSSGITNEGAYRTLIFVLGFDKLLGPMREMFDKVLDTLIVSGEVTMDSNNKVRYNK